MHLMSHDKMSKVFNSLKHFSLVANSRGKFTYGTCTFQKANNTGADQTARMRRLVCACVVRKPPKTGFLTTMPIYAEVSQIMIFK